MAHQRVPTLAPHPLAVLLADSHAAAQQARPVKLSDLVCWRALDGRPCLTPDLQTQSLQAIIVPIPPTAGASSKHKQLAAVSKPQPDATFSSATAAFPDALTHGPTAPQPAWLKYSTSQPAAGSSSSTAARDRRASSQPEASDWQQLLMQCQKIASMLTSEGLTVHVDGNSRTTPGAKFHRWEAAGVMLRVEVGQQELSSGTACLAVHPAWRQLAQQVLDGTPPPALAQQQLQQQQQHWQNAGQPTASTAANGQRRASANKGGQQSRRVLRIPGLSDKQLAAWCQALIAQHTRAQSVTVQAAPPASSVARCTGTGCCGQCAVVQAADLICREQRQERQQQQQQERQQEEEKQQGKEKQLQQEKQQQGKEQQGQADKSGLGSVIEPASDRSGSAAVEAPLWDPRCTKLHLWPGANQPASLWSASGLLQLLHPAASSCESQHADLSTNTPSPLNTQQGIPDTSQTDCTGKKKRALVTLSHVVCLDHVRHLVGLGHACHCHVGHVSLGDMKREVERQVVLQGRGCVVGWTEYKGTSTERHGGAWKARDGARAAGVGAREAGDRASRGILETQSGPPSQQGTDGQVQTLGLDMQPDTRSTTTDTRSEESDGGDAVEGSEVDKGDQAYGCGTEQQGHRGDAISQQCVVGSSRLGDLMTLAVNCIPMGVSASNARDAIARAVAAFGQARVRVPRAQGGGTHGWGRVIASADVARRLLTELNATELMIGNNSSSSNSRSFTLSLSPSCGRKDALFADVPSAAVRSRLRLDPTAAYSVTDAATAAAMAGAIVCVARSLQTFSQKQFSLRTFPHDSTTVASHTALPVAASVWEGAVEVKAGAMAVGGLAVIDGTACAGGNTIALARALGGDSHVTAVELVEERAADLLHNLRLLGLVPPPFHGPSKALTSSFPAVFLTPLSSPPRTEGHVNNTTNSNNNNSNNSNGTSAVLQAPLQQGFPAAVDRQGIAASENGSGAKATVERQGPAAIGAALTLAGLEAGPVGDAPNQPGSGIQPSSQTSAGQGSIASNTASIVDAESGANVPLGSDMVATAAVQVLCGDFTALWSHFQPVDCVMLDPPWGGPAYQATGMATAVSKASEPTFHHVNATGSASEPTSASTLQQETNQTQPNTTQGMLRHGQLTDTQLSTNCTRGSGNVQAPPCSCPPGPGLKLGSMPLCILSGMLLGSGAARCVALKLPTSGSAYHAGLVACAARAAAETEATATDQGSQQATPAPDQPPPQSEHVSSVAMCPPSQPATCSAATSAESRGLLDGFPLPRPVLWAARVLFGRSCLLLITRLPSAGTRAQAGPSENEEDEDEEQDSVLNSTCSSEGTCEQRQGAQAGAQSGAAETLRVALRAWAKEQGATCQVLGLFSS